LLSTSRQADAAGRLYGVFPKTISGRSAGWGIRTRWFTG